MKKKDVLEKFPKGKGEKILLVDDMEINLEALSVNLKSKGYDVSKALLAKKAFDTLKDGGYDLIISDVMMPEMDGYELVEKIRGDQEHKDLPIILLTAKTRIEDKQKGFEVGADDYMVKPFEIGELLLRIRKALDDKGPKLDDRVKTNNKVYDIQENEEYNILEKGNKERILVIDDNPVNLEVVKTRLEMNNWKIDIALSGEEGLKKYGELRPSLVLLDIMMPGMNGYEVCKRIRKEYKGDFTPIIFLSAKQRAR